MNKFLWILILTTLLPSVAWGVDLNWSSSDQDRSIYYLGQIFGQMGVVLIGQGGEIIGELLRIFNIAVLTVGTLVVVYSVIASTLSTAQEGEVMGKKWSSIWIPVRSAAGLALMLPTASGFSLIQILMMWIVLQGVHGANQIWGIILDKASQGQGLTNTLNVSNMRPTVTGIFEAAVCYHMLNADDEFVESNDGEQVRLYPAPNNLNQLWIGVRNSSSYARVCGTIETAPLHSNARDPDQWRRQQLAAGELAFMAMSPDAAEAIQDASQWSGVDVLKDGARSMRGAITNIDLNSSISTSYIEALGLPPSIVEALQSQIAASLDEMYTIASEDGWIHAANYYWKLQDSGTATDTLAPPTFTPANNSFYTTAKNKAAAYLMESDYRTETAPSTTSSITISGPSNLSSEARQALGGSVGGLTRVMVNFVNTLSTGQSDPIRSFQKIGSDIMVATEVIFFALIVALPILMGIACVASGANPACFVLGTVIVILFPILILLLALLWSAGVMMGIYIPLIPYFVFTFTALGWIMLVVETIVAAPIVALGITSPGQEALGKASPAVLLITNVFLRPSLILIGFIAAARLIHAVIAMLNYGFEMFVYQNISDLMLFGNIAMVIIYAGIAVAAIHQTFSLVYVLPDKVIRWIGGQAEQSQVERMMEETKKSSESAADSTGALMKSAGAEVVESAKAAVKKGSGEGEGEGGGGGGGASLSSGGGGGAPPVGGAV